MLSCMKTTQSRAARLRRTAAMASVATLSLVILPMGGCSPSETLEVVDPALIYPENVQSAAGANAVRLGALNRLNTATSGGESMLLLGGLFADEWINGDSFIGRQQIDRRAIPADNPDITGAQRSLHRARVAARQALTLLDEFAASGPAWHKAEMHFIQAYTVNILAEHYCDGIVLSEIVGRQEEYGSPITTAQAFDEALSQANAGLALLEGTTPAADTLQRNRVRNALRLIKGRILLNQNQATQAAAAVAAVPTNYRYTNTHNVNTNLNQFWNLNNNARRYSVGNNEGTNGLNFATAGDPRVPVCVGNDAACRAIGVTRSNRDDLGTPFHVQRLWPTRESSFDVLVGVEARLIEAEALLPTNPAGALLILNQARTTVPGLTPLVDAGTPEGRVTQLFRERAFWLFGRGTRTGDLRRLIRQYGRTEDAVFPTGTWHKGGPYGDDVNFPVPQTEQNNPNVPSGQVCLNRNP